MSWTLISPLSASSARKWSDQMQCIAIRHANSRSNMSATYFSLDKCSKQTSGKTCQTREKRSAVSKSTMKWLQQVNRLNNRSQFVSMSSKTHNAGNWVHIHPAECGATDECFRSCTRWFYSPMRCQPKVDQPWQYVWIQIWTFFVLVLFNPSVFTTM